MTVVLLSGGLASSTALAELLAYELGRNERRPLALFVDYGQLAAPRERNAAREVAERLAVTLLELDLTAYGRLVHSAVTTAGEPIPEGDPAAATGEPAKVPGLIGVLLAVASGVALSHGHGQVVFGTAPHLEEPVAVDVLSAFTDRPFTDLGDVALSDHGGRDAGLEPLAASTWSCLEAGPEHCGRCTGCTDRRAALLEGDPTRYATATV